MPELKYKPVKHNHEQFLAKASSRKGFLQAYKALELKYQIINQRLNNERKVKKQSFS